MCWKYIGELKKGRFKGIGLELGEYSEMYDGIVDYYFGEFKDSRKSGFGLDVIGDVYVCGEFKKGYPNGEVVEYYKDLLVYEGGMKDGDFSGKVDFSDLKWKIAEDVSINYGVFLNNVISFIIVAFAVFVLIKAVNKLQETVIKEEAAAPTTKKCPYCCENIPLEAVRCPHCTSEP